MHRKVLSFDLQVAIRVPVVAPQAKANSSAGNEIGTPAFASSL
jgi:hypothetical protein